MVPFPMVSAQKEDQTLGRFMGTYSALPEFRRVFRVALKEVLSLYSTARAEDEEPRSPRLCSQGGQHVWRDPGLPSGPRTADYVAIRAT